MPVWQTDFLMGGLKDFKSCIYDVYSERRWSAAEMWDQLCFVPRWVGCLCESVTQFGDSAALQTPWGYGNNDSPKKLTHVCVSVCHSYG